MKLPKELRNDLELYCYDYFDAFFIHMDNPNILIEWKEKRQTAPRILHDKTHTHQTITGFSSGRTYKLYYQHFSQYDLVYKFTSELERPKYLPPPNEIQLMDRHRIYFISANTSVFSSFKHIHNTIAGVYHNPIHPSKFICPIGGVYEGLYFYENNENTHSTTHVLHPFGQFKWYEVVDKHERELERQHNIIHSYYNYAINLITFGWL